MPESLTSSANDMRTPNTRHLLYLYGAVTQMELNGFLDIHSIDPEEKKNEIRQNWSSAASRFHELKTSEAGLAETISTNKLDESSNPLLQEARNSPTFKNTFSSFPYDFEEVEIDKLIAGQRSVHLQYVEGIAERYKKESADLLSFCVVPSQDKTPVITGRTAQNAFTASSENPGLRFLGAFEQPYKEGLLQGQTPGGQPVRAVVLVLGYGYSTANAYRVDKRVILNNGFHRLYALRKMGIERVPMVVQKITHPELELPNVISELPRQYLVQEARPALLKDFLDDKLTCSVTQRSFVKSVQIGWGVNETIVPR